MGIPCAGVATLRLGLLALLLVGTMPASAAQLAPGDVLAVLSEYSIVRLDPDGGAPETLFSVTGSGLTNLYAIAVDRSGRILVLAIGGGRWLARVDPASGTQQLVAALPAVPFPFSMAANRGGDQIVYIDTAGNVRRVNLATGTVATVAALGGSTGTYALALAPDGTLYVSDDGDDVLLRIDPESGASAIVAEGVEFGGWYRAHGIDVDSAGRILGTRYDPPAILRVDPVTGEQETVAAGGLLDFPVEIEIDREDRVLAGNLWAGDVVRIDLETGEQTRMETPGVGLIGLAVVPHPECSNWRDDDGDGYADHPDDPGCLDANSPREDPACDDGVDNDGDGGIDWNGGSTESPDPQCTTAHGPRETPNGCGLGAELAGVLAALLSRTRRWSSHDWHAEKAQRMNGVGEGARTPDLRDHNPAL